MGFGVWWVQVKDLRSKKQKSENKSASIRGGQQAEKYEFSNSCLFKQADAVFWTFKIELVGGL